MKSVIDDDTPHLGFQIAPMIDVVFVIMLFFMVMAGAVKVENHLISNLPGSVESDSVDFVDETIINIAEDGEIALNDEPMDTPTSKAMPALKGSLKRLKDNATSSGNKMVVTIVSEGQAPYDRVVDALNALSAAQITDVTFTVSEEE
jgi:biopolymer transport protein ExbD